MTSIFIFVNMGQLRICAAITHEKRCDALEPPKKHMQTPSLANRLGQETRPPSTNSTLLADEVLTQRVPQ